MLISLLGHASIPRHVISAFAMTDVVDAVAPRASVTNINYPGNLSVTYGFDTAGCHGQPGSLFK